VSIVTTRLRITGREKLYCEHLVCNHFLLFKLRVFKLDLYICVQLLPVLHVGRAGISAFPKEHQNLITEAHYILATTSLKFRARITKFQGDVPEALNHGISLVRLVICTDHVQLAAAERTKKSWSFYPCKHFPFGMTWRFEIAHARIWQALRAFSSFVSIDQSSDLEEKAPKIRVGFLSRKFVSWCRIPVEGNMPNDLSSPLADPGPTLDFSSFNWSCADLLLIKISGRMFQDFWARPGCLPLQTWHNCITDHLTRAGKEMLKETNQNRTTLKAVEDPLDRKWEENNRYFLSSLANGLIKCKIFLALRYVRIWIQNSNWMSKLSPRALTLILTLCSYLLGSSWGTSERWSNRSLSE
jgi:hypothetical protein